MKRSEINGLLREAKAFFEEREFYLPPFAFWTADDWATKGHEADEIRLNGLGWDLTDFGSGRFAEMGLTLFTIRNGRLDDPEGKGYAEKAMISDVGQVCPCHHHWHKVEDIINRGGGKLAIELWNATEDDRLADTPVEITCDGVVRRLEAGGKIVLEPGESITLPQKLFHTFYAEEAKVFIGEVSAVNDDNTDNCFTEPVGRFPEIEEDEPPLHLLCSEYPEAD